MSFLRGLRRAVGERRFGYRELAALMEREVFDTTGAAAFLDISPNSLQMASLRKRVAFVDFGRLRLYTRADLLDYARRRGTGRGSLLTSKPSYVVWSGQLIERGGGPEGEEGHGTTLDSIPSGQKTYDS
jgi:hypothetical protein